MLDSVGYCVYCGGLLAGPEEQHRACCVKCRAIKDAERQLWEARERVCPWCESEDVLPIVYGSPGPWVLRMTAEEKGVWGGCIVDGHEPQWFCVRCHGRWGGPRRDESRYCNQCGRRSSETWCRECRCRIMEDACRILGEAANAAEAKAKREPAIVLLTLVLLTSAPHHRLQEPL
jgi:hypothetical protein